MNPKFERIEDENGHIIGQRKRYENGDTDLRLLDHEGTYTSWEQETSIQTQSNDEQDELYGTSKQFDAELRAAEKHFTRQHPKPEEFSPEMAADIMREEEIENTVKKAMIDYAESPELSTEIEKELIKDLAAQEGPDEARDQIDMHVPGAKDDASKQLAALVLGGFSGALQEVIKVGTYGAEKYSPNGWMHVPNAHDRYQNAAMRHWLKCMDGKTFNEEDGNVRHLAQCIWNLSAVLEFELAEDQIRQMGSQ